MKFRKPVNPNTRVNEARIHAAWGAIPGMDPSLLEQVQELKEMGLRLRLSMYRTETEACARCRPGDPCWFHRTWRERVIREIRNAD